MSVFVTRYEHQRERRRRKERDTLETRILFYLLLFKKYNYKYIVISMKYTSIHSNGKKRGLLMLCAPYSSC